MAREPVSSTVIPRPADVLAQAVEDPGQHARGAAVQGPAGSGVGVGVEMADGESAARFQGRQGPRAAMIGDVARAGNGGPSGPDSFDPLGVRSG